MFTLTLLALPAMARPDADALVRCWQQAVPWLRQASAWPVPPVTDADLARVAAGQVARRRVDQPPHARGGVDLVLGVGWVPDPPEAVWIGALDDAHSGLVEDLVEVQLPGTTPTRKILYQRVDLPFPITDRHWVIDIRSTADLFRVSGGRAWERTWTLDPRGQAALASLPARAQPRDEATWTPVNEGTWLLLEAEGGTLVVYRVRTDIGGLIPADLVARWSVRKMVEFIEGMHRLAAGVPTHYVGDHPRFLRPDGTPIEPYGVRP